MHSDPIPLEPTTTIAINPNYMAAIDAREEISLLLAKIETLTSGVLGLAALEELDALSLRFRNAVLQARKAHILVEAERAARRVSSSQDSSEHVSPLRQYTAQDLHQDVSGFFGRAH